MIEAMFAGFGDALLQIHLAGMAAGRCRVDCRVPPVRSTKPVVSLCSNYCHSSRIERLCIVGTINFSPMSNADVKKRFGAVVKTWRNKSGISQEELAWRAGLHRSYVADIERGARNASLQTIEKLAKALNLSFSTLFQPFGDFPVEAGGLRADDRVDILLV